MRMEPFSFCSFSDVPQTVRLEIPDWIRPRKHFTFNPGLNPVSFFTCLYNNMFSGLICWVSWIFLLSAGLLLKVPHYVKFTIPNFLPFMVLLSVFILVRKVCFLLAVFLYIVLLVSRGLIMLLFPEKRNHCLFVFNNQSQHVVFNTNCNTESKNPLKLPLRSAWKIW